MILLFDITNPDRASKAINAYSNILRWHDDAWRDKDSQEYIIDTVDSNTCISASEYWFLVHESDLAEFFTYKCKWSDDLKDQPVVRFSGGDLSDKVGKKNWVRYRSVSAIEPFTNEELIALEKWVLNGCHDEDKPWLLFESKQLYLSSLSILLQLAKLIIDSSPSQKNDLTNQSFNVISREWWCKKLSKENDFDEKIKIEWTRRKGSPPSDSDELTLFLNWVKKINYNEYNFQLKCASLLEEVKNAI